MHAFRLQPHVYYMGQCGGVIRELSEARVKCMVLSVAWRNVGDDWRKLRDA